MPIALSLRGSRRLMLAALLVVGLYIALEWLLLGVLGLALDTGLRPGGVSSSDIERDAQRVAAGAAARDAALGPEVRLAAWRLGRNLGFASQLSDALALGAVADAERSRAALASVLDEVKADAGTLGIPPPAPLTSTTLAGSSDLSRRFEADEGGTATAIATHTTERHRHLYLAGLHAGAAMYTRMVVPDLRGLASSGDLERRARIAALPRALWEPLVRPPGTSGAARRDGMIAATSRVEAWLAQSESALPSATSDPP